MPLRTPNNPNTDNAILTVLKALIANDPATGQSNTIIGQNLVTLGPGKDLIWIESKYKMSQGDFPAIHLSSGHQIYSKVGGPHMYGGLYQAELEYYDRWDLQPTTIDDIRKNIAADLERIKANLEDNTSLVLNQQPHAFGIPKMQLSPYKGSFDTQFPGMTLVFRTLSLTIDILPYESA